MKVEGSVRYDFVLRILAIIFLALPVIGYGVVELHQFSNALNEQRYRELNQELRCPKCQNQSLADSNSPIAVDMRAAVYRMVEAGYSDEAIKDYLVARFGEFILYRPQLGLDTAVLWFAPVVILLLGLIGWFVFVRSLKHQEEDITSNQNQSRLKIGEGKGADL